MEKKKVVKVLNAFERNAIYVCVFIYAYVYISVHIYICMLCMYIIKCYRSTCTYSLCKAMKKCTTTH